MSMVERVARAIADPILKEFDGFRLDKEVEWDKLPESRDQATLLRIARAAIEAMRQPNEQQIAAAWDVITAEKQGQGITRLMPGLGAREIYQAMVSAVLGEGE